MANVLKLRLLALLVAGIAVCSGPAGANLADVSLALEPVVSGLARPIGLVNAGDGSERLFAVEKNGAIRVIENGQVLASPFLTLTVSTNSERGLLGLAFHPSYETNGSFFVHYTDPAGDTVISRFQVSAGDPNVADAGSELVLLTADQPFANHNGGQIAFGPDGFLYVALGDGGSGGDPEENGQDLSTVLGKLLRIDVDSTDPGLAYAIPPSNPFVGDPGVREEIWAYGLRNPWRFSFDRLTGDLFIADVGQNQFEEVNFQAAGDPGGQNYGWDCFEASSSFEPAGCPESGFTFPILEYSHANGDCSVTGGFVYRGQAFPKLQGIFLFADFCTGRLWGAEPDAMGGWDMELLLDLPFNVTTFGEDEAGELYVVEFNASSGTVHHLVETTTIFADGFESGDLSRWDRVGGR